MSEHQIKAGLAPASRQFNTPSSPAPSQAKEEDPRERAARRAREIIEHLDGSGLNDNKDRFWFDPDIIPDGWVYNWKRWSVYNAEDPKYLSGLQRLGWDYVPVERHPEMMPQGAKGHILLDGMVLMERPQQIEDMAKSRDLKAARDQVRVKEQQLTNAPTPGQFDRDNKGTPLVKVRKNWEPVQIPD